MAKKPTTQKKKDVVKHLRHEIEMVAGLTQRLTEFRVLLATSLPATDATTRALLRMTGRNADIDSFAIHTRQLVEFFYVQSSKGNAAAGDFFATEADWDACRPTLPASLNPIWRRVGGEVAHLSYDRKDTPDDWPYEQMWVDLASVLRVFLDNVPSTYIGPDFRSAVLALLPTAVATHPASTPPSFPPGTASPPAVPGPGTAITHLPLQGA